MADGSGSHAAHGRDMIEDVADDAGGRDTARLEPYWRYDPGTDAHYWWDGQRYSAVAKWDGSSWTTKSLVARTRTTTPREPGARLGSVTLAISLTGVFLLWVGLAGLFGCDEATPCDRGELALGWGLLGSGIGLQIVAVLVGSIGRHRLRTRGSSTEDNELSIGLMISGAIIGLVLLVLAAAGLSAL